MDPNLQPLLDSIRTRSLATEGIATVKSYLNGLGACLQDPACADRYFGQGTNDEWQKVLGEADSRLVYRHPDMVVMASSRHLADVKAFGVSTPGSILDFECVITATRKDRDGDVLESEGAELDPAMPLLWQHLPLSPLGKMVRKTGQTKAMVSGHFAIADIPLGRDAATLVEFGALRISHGFAPKEYSPLAREKGEEGEPGFRVTRFVVYETSLVSVPSNESAIITAISRQKLHHPLIKAWATALWEKQPESVRGIELPWKKDCACGNTCSTCSPPEKALLDDSPSGGENIAPEVCTYPGCKEKVKPGTKFCPTHQPTAKPETETQAKKSDPLRWNKSWSKAFDVDAAILEPATTEYDWVAKYIGCPVRKLFPNRTGVPGARMGSFLTGLKILLAESKLESVRNLSRDKEVPPQYDVVELNSKQRDTFLVDGAAFYKGTVGNFVVAYQPDFSGIYVTIYTDLDHRAFSMKLLDDAWQWARDNNFLKGEAFALSGEFLPKTKETWDNVFLENRNKKAMRRTVEQLNSKGKNFANRGSILCGPPGTGKTLVGRIIRNFADASFIWISSRDFHRGGGFGGMSFGFELARELAPSVLFVEDVDNWLDGYTVDLIKTEMDGIARSSGVLTILTTNFPEQLPEALIDRPGRFHDVLKFDLPSESARKEMLLAWLPGLDATSINAAVAGTSGYSGAHVYELAAFAKTLNEQDEMSLPEAVKESLRRIAEQKELINDLQLAGSRYQPTRRRDTVVPVKMAEVIASKEITSMLTKGRMSKSDHSALGDAMTHAGAAAAHDGAPDECKTKCMKAATYIKEVHDRHAPDPSPEGKDDLLNDMETGKAYKAISAKEIGLMGKAMRSLKKAANHPEMPALAKTYAEKAATLVKQVHDRHYEEVDDDAEDLLDDGMDEDRERKDADTYAAKLLGMLLTGSHVKAALLEQLQDTIAVNLQVEVERELDVLLTA